MGVTGSRRIACDTLSEVRATGAYVDGALSRALGRSAYTERDIGYGSRLARLSVATYPVVREILAHYLEKPAGLPPKVHDALAVSATELIYLDAPAHVVDQGVELVTGVSPAFANVANAVLRRVSAERDSIRTASLGAEYGFEEWLARQLRDEYGEALARQVMQVSNEQAPVFGYVLSSAPPDWERTLAKAGARIIAHKDRCIEIQNLHAVREHPLIVSRSVLIVDRSAQASIALAPIKRRMAEVGCGRGTKTLIWADRALEARTTGDGFSGSTGEDATHRLFGIDKNGAKIKRARQVARDLGYDEITYQEADATEQDSFGDGAYDAVFVDAPCSGLGTLRRHSDKRMTLTRDDIVRLALLASALLRTASRKVAKGGTLLYATCTISRRENDSVVREFLDMSDGKGFRIDRIDASEVPDDGICAVFEEGFVQMIPQSGGGDGHFVARLRRD